MAHNLPPPSSCNHSHTHTRTPSRTGCVSLLVQLSLSFPSCSVTVSSISFYFSQFILSVFHLICLSVFISPYYLSLSTFFAFLFSFPLLIYFFSYQFLTYCQSIPLLIRSLLLFFSNHASFFTGGWGLLSNSLSQHTSLFFSTFSHHLHISILFVVRSCIYHFIFSSLNFSVLHVSL